MATDTRPREGDLMLSCWPQTSCSRELGGVNQTLRRAALMLKLCCEGVLSGRGWHLLCVWLPLREINDRLNVSDLPSLVLARAV